MKKVFPITVSVITALSALFGGTHCSVPNVDKTYIHKDGTIVNITMPKCNLYVAPIKPVQAHKILRADTLSRVVRL